MKCLPVHLEEWSGPLDQSRGTSAPCRKKALTPTKRPADSQAFRLFDLIAWPGIKVNVFNSFWQHIKFQTMTFICRGCFNLLKNAQSVLTPSDDQQFMLSHDSCHLPYTHHRFQKLESSVTKESRRSPHVYTHTRTTTLQTTNKHNYKQHTNTQTHKRTNTQTHKHTSTQTHTSSNKKCVTLRRPCVVANV